MGTAAVPAATCSYDIQRAPMDHRNAFNTARSSNNVPSAGQRLIAIDAIVDVIFSFSTPRTIIALAQTRRASYLIAASYFRAAYNPERFLHQFLPDPTDVRAFRSLQAKTCVVVYGKTVRNFLARAPFTDTEMDLSVDGSYATRVNEFLTGAGYDMEAREKDSVFTKEEDGQLVRKIVLRIEKRSATRDLVRGFPSGTWRAAASRNKNNSLADFTEFTDVLTFDGAYSLFPAQYDKPNIENPLASAELPQPIPQPIYRSFSDRSSWVVSFEKTNIVPPRLAFGVPAPVRDPLYTSSCVLAYKCDLELPSDVIWLRAVVFRSPRLKFTHAICCSRLREFVQQLLTRLVLAYPERAKLWYAIRIPSLELHIFLSASCAASTLRWRNSCVFSLKG
jgi:hypothetical protein